MIAIVSTADEFLRAIWAAPHEDAPREQYGAWLIEQGDPRGELITLQFARHRGTDAPTGKARERELITANARAWMGEIEPAVMKSRYAFERGFLVRCAVQWQVLGTRPDLMIHPAWATVREYTLAQPGERSCDRWLDHMIALGAKRV
jgi:uncharacterized protein (TIGR02996 family)